MAKRKAGLHKEVSAIFDGIPIPNENGHQPTPKTREQKPAGHIPPATSMSTSQIQPKSVFVIDRTEVDAPPETATAPKQKAVVHPQDRNEIADKQGISLKLQEKWKQIKDKYFAPRPGVSTKRQTTMAMLVPVLFVIFVVVLFSVLGPSSSKGKTSSDFQPSGSVGASKKEAEWHIPEPYPTTLRDPMQKVSVVSRQVTGNGLAVSGTFVSARPSAVVNGNIVYEGDEVAGWTIVKISEGNVQVEKDGENRTLRVQYGKSTDTLESER